MFVSRNTLEQYISLTGISDQEIATRLTFAGIEVEDFYPLARASHLIIGHVIKTEKLEGSDHLSHCLVDLGPAVGHKQIVCGAPNVRAGLKVIVAQVGAVLPEVVIKKAVIKGVPSEGMICSLKELGVKDELLSPEDINGIHELPLDAPTGSVEVLEYLGLADTIFDLKPLANRPDMLAIYNIVRELGALFERAYNLPSYENSADFKTALTLDVKTDKVPAFALCEVKGLTIGPSPAWLQMFLKKHGQRPVNHIVDIGNYVMLMTGRPLHMYDLDRTVGHHFVVSDDTSFSFVALDEKTYALKPGDQVIHNGQEVLCLGGVMGALGSAVTEQTSRIAIEVALFDGAQIRQTVTRLNLPSEASSRFSKGVNPHNMNEAMALALHLIKQENHTAKVSQLVTYQKEMPASIPLIFNYEKINELLGTTFSRDEMVDTLKRLDIVVADDNRVTLPSYRQDMTSGADLAEEIIRVLGFSHIHEALPRLVTTLGEYDEVQKARYDIRKLLRNIGLYETLSYTLVSEAQTKMFTYLNQDCPLTLEHPMTPLRAYLRTNLLPSLLETVSYNVSRQAKDFALFEVSNVTSQSYHGEHLVFAFYGSEKIIGELVKRPYDFSDAKGVIVMILDYLGINESRYDVVPNIKFIEGLHPAQSALLKVAGKIVGVFGKLHPTSQKDLGLNEATYVGEIDFGTLIQLKTSRQKVTPPSRFPFVSRDLALLVDHQVSVGELQKVIKSAGGKLVVAVQVFDVYTKLVATPEKKSVAIKINLQDSEKTLVEADIKKTMETIVESLKNKLNAEVRS